MNNLHTNLNFKLLNPLKDTISLKMAFLSSLIEWRSWISVNMTIHWPLWPSLCRRASHLLLNLKQNRPNLWKVDKKVKLYTIFQFLVKLLTKAPISRHHWLEISNPLSPLKSANWSCPWSIFTEFALTFEF